jgi:hypothetical protein
MRRLALLLGLFAGLLLSAIVHPIRFYRAMRAAFTAARIRREGLAA